MPPKVDFVKSYAENLEKRLQSIRYQADIVLTNHHLGPNVLRAIKAGGHPEGVNGFTTFWQQYATAIREPWTRITNLTRTTQTSLLDVILIMDETTDLADAEVAKYRNELGPTVAGYRGLSAPITPVGSGNTGGGTGGTPAP
jgi:hypothetical protein